MYRYLVYLYLFYDTFVVRISKRHNFCWTILLKLSLQTWFGVKYQFKTLSVTMSPLHIHQLPARLQDFSSAGVGEDREEDVPQSSTANIPTQAINFKMLFFLSGSTLILQDLHFKCLLHVLGENKIRLIAKSKGLKHMFWCLLIPSCNISTCETRL